ncbi:MAG: ATP-binding protein, partial [Stackebrandtia sp.]
MNPPTGQHQTVNPQTGQHPAVNPATGQHQTVNPPTGSHRVVPQAPAAGPQSNAPQSPAPVNPPTGQHRPVRQQPNPYVEPRSGQHPTADPRLATRTGPGAPPVNPPSGQHPTVNPPSGQHATVDPRLSKRAAPPQTAPADPQDQQLVPLARTAPETAPSKKPAKLPKPPKQKDRSAAQELAITEIAGHATFTPTSVTAWYRLPEVRWAFRPDAEREALISAIAEQYAGMAGYRLHLRRTTRPFPADQWARTVDTNTPQPLPPVRGAPTWADHLVNAQHHLHNVQHAEGETYLGISFARRTLTDTLGEKFGRVFNRGTKRSERSRIERATEQFDEVLSAFGVRARRATSQELEWLIFRSVALGMDPPNLLSGVRDGLWEPGDVLALTEQIERYRTPYGSTVKLVNRLTGEERHVAVLTVGRMEDLDIPERHEPWLHFHERAPWPMEISSRLDILGPGEAFRNLEHRLRMIRSQQHDYDEHAMDAPPELERLAQRALNVGDEMTTGLATDAARVHGWHRIAVAADDREECLERAR